MKQTGNISLPAQEKSLKERAADREQRSVAMNAVKTFRAAANPSALQPQAKSISLQDQLNNERLKEIRFKQYFRILSSSFFALLLAGQNIAVFTVIIISLQKGTVKDLQLIFSALVAATLTETYFITKIIINFIFSTIDYSSDKKQTQVPQVLQQG